MKTKITAIVPAAGLGKRFDASIRKTFAELGGEPLLVHTLKRLQSEDTITEIIPVLRQQDIEKGLQMVKQHKLDKIKRIAEGGKERQDSIYNALKLIEAPGDSLVLIHDGARPVIPEGTVERLAEGLKGSDGIIPGLPPKDTLKEVDENGIVIATLNREKIRAVQTPQMFFFSTIKKAYDDAYKDGFYATDDAALVERSGGRIKIIEGSPYNIKVTTPEDLEMVRHILAKN